MRARILVQLMLFNKLKEFGQSSCDKNSRRNIITKPCRILWLVAIVGLFFLLPPRMAAQSGPPTQAQTTFITSTFPVGNGPVALALNAVTDRLYVANQASNTVSVVDPTTNSVLATIAVGKAPSAIAVNTRTNTIYVADRDSRDIAVIDGTSNTLIATVHDPVGEPGALGVDEANNQIWVGTPSGTGTEAPLVVIEGASLQTSQPDKDGSLSPVAFVASALSGRVYVAF